MCFKYISSCACTHPPVYFTDLVLTASEPAKHVFCDILGIQSLTTLIHRKSLMCSLMHQWLFPVTKLDCHPLFALFVISHAMNFLHSTLVMLITMLSCVFFS